MGLCFVSLVVAYMTMGVEFAGAADSCFATSSQAGSKIGNPCPGTLYKAKLCSSAEGDAIVLAGFMKGIIDSAMTAESCRSVIDPFCKAIQPEAKVKDTAKCELMCGMFDASAVNLCATNADCAEGAVRYSGDPTNWGSSAIGSLANSAVRSMCCSWMEKKLRLYCEGWTEANMVKFVDGTVSSRCSIQPGCLITGTASMWRASPPLVTLAAAAALMAVMVAW